MRARHVVLLLGLLGAVVMVVPVVFVAMVTAARSAGEQPAPARAGVATAKLPPLAQSMLPLVATRISETCPELSVLRVLAEVQAESGWDPRAWSEDVNGGAAGLLQINQANWIALGGRPWTSTPPSHRRYQRPQHTLDTRHRLPVRQPAGDHAAPQGDGQVRRPDGRRERLPHRRVQPGHRQPHRDSQAGEAGCDARCASLVRRYLDNIRRYERDWSATPGETGPPGMLPPGIDVGQLASANAYTGGPTGCTVPDPTTAGCVTAATANGISEVQRAFGSEVRSAGCFAPRPWNPTSDHPQGKGCDIFPDRAGIFPAGEPLRAGWRMAAWLRVNAEALRVKYVIWQGRYWDPSTGDQGGWGEPYTGGGVYDVADPTGGHYDHIHVSFRE
ncbi:hypothetical protein ACFSVJ_28300 [Prauserella oleivorans]